MKASYGVLEQTSQGSEFDTLCEEVDLLGYGALNSGFDDNFIDQLGERFNKCRSPYTEAYGRYQIEPDVIRLLPFFDEIFFQVVFNRRLHDFIKKYLSDYFVLNQVNGVINRSNEGYSQTPWHRDLPFRHFTTSRPLAVSALFALDDFTTENGCTLVLPASHKHEPLPSETIIARLQRKIEVKRGTFIILDGLTFHRGGDNLAQNDRRAINCVFTIPAWRQQFHLPSIFQLEAFDEYQRRILGYGLKEHSSLDEWFINAAQKYKGD